DLARKIETLLDDAALRERLGRAGRQRFEEHYSWDVIIERHYKPLLGPPRRPAAIEAPSDRPAAARARAGLPAVARSSKSVPGARTDLEVRPTEEGRADGDSPRRQPGGGRGFGAQAAYRPYLPAAVDHRRLLDDVGRFFGLDPAEVEAEFHAYRAFHEAQG